MGDGRARRRAHEALARAREQAVRIAEGVRLKSGKPETVPGDPVEGIPAFRELCVKIKRHKEHIPDTIRLGHGQREGRGDQQQDQTDYPQGIRFPEHREHDGHDLPGMIRHPHPAPNWNPTTRKPA